MKKTLAVIFVAVMTIGIVVGYPHSGERGELTFSLRTTKDRVLLMEPIPLKLSLENRTESPVGYFTPLDLEKIKLEIEKPDGTVVFPDRLSYLLSNIKMKAGEFPAGWKHEVKDTLTFRIGKWFDQVGKYRLRATFRNGDSTLTSEWVSLTVEAPKGSDVAPYEFLRRDAETAEWGLLVSSQLEDREAFLQQFPDSPYSDYVRYMLAKSYAKSKPARSVELFQQLQAKQDFIFAEEVSKKLRQMVPAPRAN